MSKKEIITADPSVAQAKKNAAYFKKLMTGMHMGEEHGSVREAEYKGHHIVIETCYEITIDGKPFEGMLGVTNSGDVHYHGIPNMAFPSAVDLIKKAIDVFPSEFAKGSGGGGGPHMHGTHMKMTGGRKKAAKKRSTRK